VTLNPLADTLPALQSFKSEGSSSKQNPLFEVSVLTQKKSKTASVLNPKDGTMSSVTYEQPGSVLISTQVKGSSGGYSAPLIMPARIPFGDTASVSVFGWNNASRSFGGTIRNGFLLSGTGTDSVRDVTGPEVFIRPCDSSWTAGQPLQTRASIPLPFCLQVDLQDSSGISSQEGPDEGVVFSVPGVLDPWHPELRQGDDFRQSSGLFVLSTDEFQTGKSYDFTVLARDLMGNTTRKQLNLKTVQEEAVSLYDVYNSPNPVRGTSTSFYFKLTAKQDSNGVVPAKVRASIRITTMSGKLVRVLETELDGASNGRPTAVWNLQDEFRNPVANGTYPYVVKLRVPMDAGGWKQIERRGAVVISR
jgi:hypothetical protein